MPKDQNTFAHDTEQDQHDTEQDQRDTEQDQRDTEQAQRDTGKTLETSIADEFRDLRELIAELRGEIVEMRVALSKVIEVKNAEAIDNGAVIDDAGGEDVEISDELPVIAEDRDYTFDEE